MLTSNGVNPSVSKEALQVYTVKESVHCDQDNNFQKHQSEQSVHGA